MITKDKVTLADLELLTRDGEIRWRVVDKSNTIAFDSYRATYKNRIYIVEVSRRLTVWNQFNDALIWWEKDASRLIEFIKFNLIRK